MRPHYADATDAPLHPLRAGRLYKRPPRISEAPRETNHDVLARSLLSSA
jgi:hypothetical protein